jgi:hypothetical protein
MGWGSVSRPTTEIEALWWGSATAVASADYIFRCKGNEIVVPNPARFLKKTKIFLATTELLPR